MKAPPDYGRIDLRFNSRKRRFVPESAGDKRRHCEERSDEAIQSCLRGWIASRSLSSSAHSRDPLARDDGLKLVERLPNSSCAPQMLPQWQWSLIAQGACPRETSLTGQFLFRSGFSGIRRRVAVAPLQFHFVAALFDVSRCNAVQFPKASIEI